RRDRTELLETPLEEAPTSDGETAPVPVLNAEAPGDVVPADQPTGDTVPPVAVTPGAPGTTAGAAAGATPATDPRRLAGRRRAIVVAPRRRRLFWCTLLVLASVITAAVQIMPWWGVAPSGVLMLGYLAVLRVAVGVDRERAQRAAEFRA